MTEARSHSSGTIFDSLVPQPPDAVLALIGQFREDTRAGKIDLGVGVYRNAQGRTPVFEAVKAAERALLETQETKAYLGPEGDLAFLEALEPIIFGGAVSSGDLISVQTPGGTGALRLAAELAASGKVGARVWIGTPSWPNHEQIFANAGLRISSFPYFDQRTQTIQFEAVRKALRDAEPGDLFLLHGCCHNPSGADFGEAEWAEIAQHLSARGIVPLIDLAYQGLGNGLERDVAGLQEVIANVDTAIVAYSLDKNFGLYRERTGALYVKVNGRYAEAVKSNILKAARCAWSMPPDHGAAAVRLILEDAQLKSHWRRELDLQRARLFDIRDALADADERLAPIRRQHGLFSLLAIDSEGVEALRRDHAIYMARNGRINVAGLTMDTIPAFVRALDTVLPR
ncbi:MAG: aromatic amino acid transaminase [Phenylobacterium sp.]|uniref:aromatic amino acid transaminase n=1 Tax=Phenylobacterium sp. TaxID=1871053 RepID=UPI0025D1D03C|nr:aromatic amino acid transaminase [Phenylobacterium sp.]MCG9917537.1 aromatic amino acid transaminase [Phenylobacterium sp.]